MANRASSRVHSLLWLGSILGLAAHAAPFDPANLSRALMNGATPNAWSVPRWGFSSRKISAAPANPVSRERIPARLTRSLVFDQSFDIVRGPNAAPSTKISLPEKASTTVVTTTKSNYPALDALEAWAASIPSTPASAPAKVPESARPVGRRVHFRQPPDLSARILVIDEESLAFNTPTAIEGAEVNWVSPVSGLVRKTNANGESASPYPNTVSARFVVTAPGYLPAVGYATAGVTVPVVLTKESRLGPVIKSLGVVPDPDRVLLLGKVLRADLKPAAGVRLDTSAEEPFRSYYSIGALGLFHPGAKESGTQGDFLVSGLKSGIQYLMPTEDAKEWPAWILDMTGLPQIVTTTITESSPSSAHTQVVDAFAMERPGGAVHVTVGGQRGLFLPDEEGFLNIDELHPRGSAELVEIRSEGYAKTWISAVPNPKLFPVAASVFTDKQLREVFQREPDADLAQGVVFGNLRAERFTKPVTVSVYNAAGRRQRDALVVYFDADNRATSRAKATDPVTQNFAIANLAPGEWHLVLTDPTTGRGVGAQVVRTERETVSQVQF